MFFSALHERNLILDGNSMKALSAFIKKEFLHIFRDYRTLIILFGIPGIQIIIFGYVVSTDIKNAEIAILYQSHDPVSQQIIDRLDASDFNINRILFKESDVEKVLQQGDVKQVIQFSSDFSGDLEKEGTATIGIISDGSEPNTSRLVAAYTGAIINDFIQDNTLQTARGIIPQPRMQYNPRLQDEFMFTPGLMTLILTLICALMTSVTITREKEFGTMEVLLVSPLRPVQIIIGKVIPYVILGFIDVLIILGMAGLVFGLPVRGNLILLLLESLLYIALALSLGVLISTLSKTMQQAMFISLLGLLLPSTILSGFIFPIDSMPVFYQYFTLIFPPRWFIIIIKNIMLKGTGPGYIWKETLILFLMTLVLLTLSAKKTKIRLE